MRLEPARREIAGDLTDSSYPPRDDGSIRLRLDVEQPSLQVTRRVSFDVAHARRVYSEHEIGLSAPISAESVQNKQPLVALYAEGVTDLSLGVSRAAAPPQVIVEGNNAACGLLLSLSRHCSRAD